jgi:ATP phosphoribosyltransferase regulatory subunit
MTPQVARMDAHRLHSGQLTRLCYCDDVLHTRPSRQSRQRWQIQAGAELFGEAGVNADLEVISLMCETLCALGVERPVIELGHVGLVKHLAHEARLDEDARRQYYSLVQHKARAEIAEFVDGLDVPAALSGALLSLPFAYGDWQRFDAVASSAGIAVPGIQAALAPVRSVGEALLARFPDLQLSFDLGEMRGYQYHTGLVFSAYLEGLDEAIASGGRYDGVGESFGRHRPATGFSMALKPLLGLMDIKSAETALIWAPANAPYASLAALRRAGQPVVQALDPESSAPVGSRCLIQKGQEWIVEEQL